MGSGQDRMSGGLTCWENAGSFAWYGASAPLQRGTVHFGRTEKDWAFALPQRPSPPLRGHLPLKGGEGLEPDWQSVADTACKGERGAAVICSAGLAP
ncbi:hypothetical protein Ga0061067_10128 [Pannonibacter indicus]|uniref:Uncharacterized protein n=1 Tax=Pannonibacter indicus TaxID=466044 RepID=A0A0K6HKX1_9HYPH|nr:hypothetical protein Ga0061067_10128 [Pannonibacter indicus]